jgi:hypothetical protein
MLNADDLARMQADLTAVRQDRPAAVVIRRGQTTLAAQTVRIARQGGQANPRDSAGGKEVRGKVVVLGGVDFDVQPEDRFNDAGGTLYRVTYVRPNRLVAVVAEAEAVG